MTLKSTREGGAKKKKKLGGAPRAGSLPVSDRLFLGTAQFPELGRFSNKQTKWRTYIKFGFAEFTRRRLDRIGNDNIGRRRLRRRTGTWARMMMILVMMQRNRHGNGRWLARAIARLLAHNDNFTSHFLFFLNSFK